ncbi:MAG: hypothetical protein EXR74_00350 [Bdellovibrionales bacterium]|nr:hypothetical protein [Bdellovibrionales bacterium]
MKLDVGNVTSHPLKSWSKIPTPAANLVQMQWDLENSVQSHIRNEQYWNDKGHTPIPTTLFESHSNIWLEIGAGTGGYFLELAKTNPKSHFVAIERCRIRARRMIHKFEKSELPNLQGFRGNAVPALITGIPSESVERIYILYPCPWPKNAHRKNRWYLHVVMPHLVRILKPQGTLIWASDQEFYIREATFVSESKHRLKTLISGQITPNSFNHLESFPEGRTSFEKKFLTSNQPCFELVSQKSGFPTQNTLS